MSVRNIGPTLSHRWTNVLVIPMYTYEDIVTLEQNRALNQHWIIVLFALLVLQPEGQSRERLQ